jgi:hypothetical protein
VAATVAVAVGNAEGNITPEAAPMDALLILCKFASVYVFYDRFTEVGDHMFTIPIFVST